MDINSIPGNATTRYVCDILEDMCKCYKTRNFSYLPGLIEELRYGCERMEAAIERMNGWDGIKSLEKERVKLKEEITELKKKKDELKGK